MRYFLIFILFIFLSARGFTQSKLTITYETKRAINESLRNSAALAKVTLVINDSFSYTYYPEIPIKPGLKNSIPLGSGYWPKSSFTNIKTCLTLFPYGEFDKPKQQRLVADSCQKGEWEIYDMMTKEILGYKCIRAVGVLHDSRMEVWYAPDLPASFAPHFSPNLPGTVLEFWYENTLYITTAIEIKKEAVEIVEPDFCERINRAEYDRIIRKKKKYTSTTIPKGIPVRIL